MPVVRLTAKERILIHLADFAKYAEKPEVPPEMGQEGIARAVGIYVQHVRQFIDPLLKESLLRERTAHVAGHRRRLKIYDLTNAGRLAAARLREQVREESVRVRDADGVRTTTVGELNREAEGKVSLGSIARAAMEGRTVDLTPGEARSSDQFVERLSEVPRLGAFVGRQAEIEALTSVEVGPRFFVVRGVAGIGKSSLAAKVCERLRGTRNLWWHRIRPWDTRQTILADLGAFLAQQGRPGLQSVLSLGEPDRADGILADDLVGTTSFLVFDDAHEAAPEVVSFLRFLKDTLAQSSHVRVLVLTRKALPAYDRRDVSVTGQVQEIDLGGLDSTAVGELLSTDPEGPGLIPLAGRFGGHPLFLELLRATHRADLPKAALRDVRRFIEEEIYGKVSAEERKMLKVASLYEVPVPREALLVDEHLSHDVLLSLQGRTLLQRVGEDAFEAHDTIREFFASILTPAERRTLALFAVEELRRLAAHNRDARNPVASVHALSNALRLAEGDSVRSSLFESLGDVNEQIGDLPGTLAAYKSAFAGMEDAEGRARLHRKIAMALQNRGETTTSLAEIEAGLKELDGRRSVEGAWLDLVRCRIAMKLEEWTEAREHGDRAFQTFQSFEDPSGMGQTLLDRGRVEIDAPGGNPDRARLHLQEALGFAPAAGGAVFVARAHIEMARNLAYRIVDVDQALQHVAAAESLLETIHDPYVARALLNLKGWLALEFRADYGGAVQAFGEAMALGERIHSPMAIAFAKFGLANVEFYEGLVLEARATFEALSREMLDLGYPNFALESVWMVAQCNLWLQDRPGLLAALSRLKSAELERGVGSRPFLATVASGLDRLVSGDRDAAIRSFREAVRASEESYGSDQTSPVYFTEFYLGVGLMAVGQEEEASDHLRRCEELLRKHGLKARLSVPPDAASLFAGFLRHLSRRT